MSSPQLRSNLLDSYRGLAVVLMILFHFCWDLRDFDFISFDDRSTFWVNFRSLIVFMFVSAVGWSSFLATQHKQPLRRFVKNQAKVAFAAALISLGTFIALPDQWVFFGILHFIFAAGWIVRPLSVHPKLSACLGIVLVGLNTFYEIDSISSHRWFIHTFSAPNATLDFVNPLLWLGVVLIGPIFGYTKLHSVVLPQNIAVKVLAFLGQHALLVYLLHQLILYPFVIGAYFLWH